jgi:hypothetical protein
MTRHIEMKKGTIRRGWLHRGRDDLWGDRVVRHSEHCDTVFVTSHLHDGMDRMLGWGHTPEVQYIEWVPATQRRVSLQAFIYHVCEYT